MAGFTKGPYWLEGPDDFGDYNIAPTHEAAVVAVAVSNLRPDDEVADNAAIVLAAFNAAHALRDAGYDAKAAIEALPDLMRGAAR